MSMAADPKDMLCDDCGEAMTLEEMQFYENHCEKCERVWLQQTEDWRHGRRKELPDRFAKQRREDRGAVAKTLEELKKAREWKEDGTKYH